MMSTPETYFEKAIEEHDVEDRWARLRFGEAKGMMREMIVHDKRKKAKGRLWRILSSPKNDASDSYMKWAVETALEIKSLPISIKRRQELSARLKQSGGNMVNTRRVRK